MTPDDRHRTIPTRTSTPRPRVDGRRGDPASATRAARHPPGDQDRGNPGSDSGRDEQGVRSTDAGWLLLLPLVCCGGPLVIVAAASAGALGWGALGAGVAAVIAAVLLIARRRAARSCEAASHPIPTGSGPRGGARR